MRKVGVRAKRNLLMIVMLSWAIASAVLPLHAAEPIAENSRALTLKAIACKPHSRQVAWQENEFSGFVHFGVNTFTGREWGTGKEDPTIFNPTELDTDQWCRAMKAAGMKLVVFTAKHHDGFCLWQTRYTKHAVSSSPWRDGKGDVLRDLSHSCKKFGLKLGVYLSPADLYQIENADGLYGNLSQYSRRTIPRPVPGRPFRDQRTFEFEVDDYNEYFLNQLFELLTEYGPIHEVWFDGAHPKRKGGQKYTYNQWYELIRELAPDAAIFGKGPDVRWIGNESGGNRPSEWSVVAIGGRPDNWTWPDMTGQDLGSLAKLKQTLEQGGFLHWYPAEADTSIRHGWFWRDERQQVKPAERILDIWYRTVGGNAVLLLNVPPNRQGRLAERDVRVLADVGAVLRETFAKNLAVGASATASATRGSDFAAANILDGDPKTCWMPPDWHGPSDVVITLPKPQTFNRVVFQEQIGDYSQRIARFAVDVFQDGQWNQIAAGTTVGYKRICRTAVVTTDRLRLRVLESRVAPTISNFELYREPLRLGRASIVRDRQGNVTISGQQAGQVICYSLDGSEPTSKSLRFESSISLPSGGTVRARIFDLASGRVGETTTAVYDICSAKWKVISASSEQANAGESRDNVIDGDPKTIWHSRWRPDKPRHPHEIVIDLGESIQLRGFSYTPRSQSRQTGTILDYAVYVSADGKTWGAPVAKGQFSNIKNNPVQQFVRFATPVTGRFLRLVALSEVNGGPHASAAEIGVITSQ